MAKCPLVAERGGRMTIRLVLVTSDGIRYESVADCEPVLIPSDVEEKRDQEKPRVLLPQFTAPSEPIEQPL